MKQVTQNELMRTQWSRQKPGQLSPRNTIEAILQRERARTDRSGLPFALVVFKGPPVVGQSQSMQAVAEAVIQRMRETDDFGWTDEQTFYVLLFDANADGTRHFVRHVCNAVEHKSPAPELTIYSYPHYSDDGQQLDDINFMKMMLTGKTVEAMDNAIPVKPIDEVIRRPLPWWKRTMDIVGSSMGLMLLSPLLLGLAAAVKFTSPGPVIFRQRRSGLGGKPFTLYKFRTMVVNAEALQAQLRAQSEQDGPAFKMRHDPRITSIGSFLRKTSLDELPQLWNVLKGDMTIVGPRPLPVDETDASNLWHKRRLDVTPGLTCIWQVSGRSRVTFDEWMRMDVRYIVKRTFVHDMKIILQTIPALTWKRNGL